MKIGTKASLWINRDRKIISPSYTRDYPFVMARGRGLRVWDQDGREYLDFTAGIATVSTGHCHPKVVAAIKRQAALFLHMSGTDFYYPSQIKLAEKLASLFPGGIARPLAGRRTRSSAQGAGGKAKVFFSNSGTEANEAGMKLARFFKKRPSFISFTGAFHGRTMGSLSLTNSKAVQRRGFAPLLPQVAHAPFAYCYRCPLNLKYPSCKIACADYIEDEIFRTQVPAEEVAALVLEPIQGEGGYVAPPPEWPAKIKALCAKYGILLMTDEVQCGMGRTGKMFALEHFGVEADIITTAKGIASGLPLGVMMSRAEIMNWPPGAHASTFGGNPVACEAAIATIALLEGGLMKNARDQGNYLKMELEKMRDEFECIGDVRGIGLMVGVELVEDRITKKRASKLRDQFINECFKAGLLMLGCGPNSLRFCPALTVSRKEINRCLDTVRAVLRRTPSTPKN